MALPRVQMDFNGNSLENSETRKDVERQNLELRPGMRCIFYQTDGQDGEIGFLHCVGTVWWDAKTQQLRLDMRVDFCFTPGTDLSVLDGLYEE